MDSRRFFDIFTLTICSLSATTDTPHTNSLE